MPRRKWIDKKSATHFTLVHRPQNDPLIHDAEASSVVLNPTPLPNSHKIKRLDDLASEFGADGDSIRANEGEAANYGIYYDDTDYDYMQHMRELGSSSGQVVFLEAPDANGKQKQKQSLDDALKNASLQDRAQLLLGEEFLPSMNLQRATYQSQQDIPDVLAGFQPDMDPRLREVLEALEDDAYVDDDEEIFQQLAQDGKELRKLEFEEVWDGDEEGWESDDTAKPAKEYKEAIEQTADVANDQEGDHGDGEWMVDFAKFKKEGKVNSKIMNSSQSELQSSLMSTTTNGGRRKKRKGALTNPSTYSMTSSSIFRTEGLTTLDARFEKLEEQYNENEDEDDTTSVSAISSTSSVQGPLRGDFDNIMDDFLGSYSMSGKKHVKKGKYQTGIEQLDAVRKELGPARIRLQRA